MALLNPRDHVFDLLTTFSNLVIVFPHDIENLFVGEQD